MTTTFERGDVVYCGILDDEVLVVDQILNSHDRKLAGYQIKDSNGLPHVVQSDYLSPLRHDSFTDFTPEVAQEMSDVWVSEQGEERITDAKTGGQKGKKLAQLGAIDPLALLELAKVAGFGAKKYERYNYLKGIDWSLFYDASERHGLAFWSGEDTDSESGLSHLAHRAWQDLALLSMWLRERGTDDRPV